MEDDPRALGDVRVLDLADEKGLYCTKLLADLGAQVIRIESSTKLDGLRIAHPIADDKAGNINCSGYFNNYNAGKLSITLNMDLPKARDLAKGLIRISDVVVDNFSPRVMQEWGFTYEELSRLKPDLIVVNVPMQGISGPHRDFIGFGAAISPLGGIAHLTGFPHRPPVGTGTNYPDYVVNPCHVAVAVLAALRYRRRTGKGQHIEVAQLESTASVLGSALLDFTVNGRVQNRQGNRIPNAAPHGAYRCRGDDRWCVIAVFTDEEWRALCGVLGNPLWTQDERFSTLLARKKNEDELDRLVEEWTSQRTAEEVMVLMQRAGVAAGVVQTSEDVLCRDEHLKARGYHVALDHSEAGRTTYDGLGFRLGKTPGEFPWPAPLLGEHNDFVFRELLGLSEEEINEYIIDGVIA